MSMMVNPYAFSVGAGVSADPYFENVILLLGFNGSDGSTSFVDESRYANSVTANGDAQIDTAQSKFGGASLLLDGTGDYLSLADQALWDLGSGDFTVELWARPVAVGGSFIGQDGGGGTGWSLAWETQSLRLNTYAPSQLQVYETSNTWTGPTGQWYHIAADRSGSAWRVYRDGNMVASATSSGTIANASAALVIGSGFGGLFNGWIEEVRLTKGVARYASNGGFTPPTSAYPRGGSVSFSVSPTISTDTGFYAEGDTATVSFTHNGLSTTYQWTRDGSPIGGATAASYTYVSGDVGHTVNCTVTASSGANNTSQSAIGSTIGTPAYATHTRVPAGDMDSGSDSRLTAGDMQSGTDLRITTERIA